MLKLAGPTVMKKQRVGIYVGLKQHFTVDGMYLYTKLEIFRSEEPPTQESVKGIFDKTLGGFKTIRGAKAYLWINRYGNPHYFCAKECERLGKENAEYLKDKERERIKM